MKKILWLYLFVCLVCFPSVITAEVKEIPANHAANGITKSKCYETKEACSEDCAKETKNDKSCDKDCAKVTVNDKACYIYVNRESFSCYYKNLDTNHRTTNGNVYYNYIKVDFYPENEDHIVILKNSNNVVDKSIKFYSSSVDMQDNYNYWINLDGNVVRVVDDLTQRYWSAKKDKSGLEYYTCPPTIKVNEDYITDRNTIAYTYDIGNRSGNDYGVVKEGDGDLIMAVVPETIPKDKENESVEVPELTELKSCSDDEWAKGFWDLKEESRSVNDKCFVCPDTNCKGKITINNCTKNVYLLYKTISQSFNVEVTATNDGYSFLEFDKQGVVDGVPFGIFRFDSENIKGTETYNWKAYTREEEESYYDYNQEAGSGEIIINKIDKKECPTDSVEDNQLHGCAVIPDVIKTWINNILNIVKYIALALVIALGALDFMKAAASGEPDQMKKAGQSFVKRLAAVVILFLVPVLVDFILELIDLYGAGGTCLE